MTNWRVQLTSCRESLGTVNVRRGIFQGDSLSPLLFLICMIPLTKVLRKVKMGYTLDGVKINHLFFMEDLKLFAKNDNEIDSLVCTVNLISQDIGMQFGVKKCGVVTMKRGKVAKSTDIERSGGDKIRETGDQRYKYLGIVELDKIKEEEMKCTYRKEYFTRVRLVMQSKLNGRNKIKAINTWVVSLIRYGAGIIKWRKDELESMDRRTRKLMTMNKELHPRSDVARLYVGRKNGGRGLISCENCINTEINNLAWYIKHIKGNIMPKVRDLGTIDVTEAMAPSEYKSKVKWELEKQWKDKPMHGQYTRASNGIDWEKSWSWLRRGDLKGCTEALVCSAQEQSLRTNYTKYHIDKTSDTPLCRMCGERGETVSHLVSECSKLAQREYKRRHDNVAKYIHWLLAEKYGFERATNWYEEKPEGVMESQDLKVLWDFVIQCDRFVQARRPDIVVVDKIKKEVKLIDIAIPGDCRVKEKEQEKIEKYEQLKEEIARLWSMKRSQ